MMEYPYTSKHTPLPWKFDRNTLGCKDIKGGKYGKHRQAKYKALAHTTGMGLNDEREQEDRANAALMTASPLLWRMVKLLASYECASIEPVECQGRDKCGPCSARDLLKDIERSAKLPDRMKEVVDGETKKD